MWEKGECWRGGAWYEEDWRGEVRDVGIVVGVLSGCLGCEDGSGDACFFIY